MNGIHLAGWVEKGGARIDGRDVFFTLILRRSGYFSSLVSAAAAVVVDRPLARRR